MWEEAPALFPVTILPELIEVEASATVPQDVIDELTAQGVHLERRADGAIIVTPNVADAPGDTAPNVDIAEVPAEEE